MPLVVEIFRPASVVDVGCGLGTWLSVFRQYGIGRILGIDGDYVDPEKLEIAPQEFLAKDLSLPFAIDDSFDLAISLEVAEHLEEEHARDFVASLTSLAPAVVFSAAIPHQDGVHHVNTQWPDYWRALFVERGYELSDCLRPQIWANDTVEFWYRQNILVFARPEVIEASPTLRAEMRVRKPLNLVHPAHWNQVMHQAAVDRASLDEARAALGRPSSSVRFRGRLQRVAHLVRRSARS